MEASHLGCGGVGGGGRGKGGNVADRFFVEDRGRIQRIHIEPFAFSPFPVHGVLSRLEKRSGSGVSKETRIERTIKPDFSPTIFVPTVQL